MMSKQLTNAMLRSLQVAGQRAAQTATAAAVAMLVDRLARGAPEIRVETGDDAVRLRARGLWARAFGSRHTAPDPALTDVIGGGR